MTHTRALIIGAVGIALSSHPVDGQELSRYRSFALGSSVASVVMLTGVQEKQVKRVHERPALLQELDWRPSQWATGTVSESTDPVEQIRFSFYDDQLFRMVINYGREQTVGMSDADLIEAIASLYGLPLQLSGRTADRVPANTDAESGAVIASWGDVDYAVTLYRRALYGGTWRLIVTKTAVETLAKRAEMQAATLDAVEAPQKEVDRQTAEHERERAAAEKARAINKPAFRP